MKNLPPTGPAESLVSIIIRTKNEERWIHSCLNAVFAQSYRRIEVIIVDNCSTDRTVQRAQEFPVKIVTIDDFAPGRAINLGIRNSAGDILVCLSGHCIPTNDSWLKNLIEDLADPMVAGVYGRQEPMSFTSDIDKRDLLTVFGLDKKVQVRDPFFHNANSAFRRRVWEKIPFDESVSNIEDRIWGRQVITSGLRIHYTPYASVFHWHGINHDLNPERAKKIVKIIESDENIYLRSSENHLSSLRNVVAFVPIRGKSLVVNKEPLLIHTINAARASKLISRIVVTTDDRETADLAVELGVEAPFLRPDYLSQDHVDTAQVLKYSLSEFECLYGVPDLVVLLEETYPFRPAGLVDDMIKTSISGGFDSVLAVKPEHRGFWFETNGAIKMQAEGFMPSELKSSRALIGLMGLGCVAHPTIIREGVLPAGRIGVIEVNDPVHSIQIRDPSSVKLAERILKLDDEV
jgi:glycosyltransferase involved in cell wall biosynthesis